MVVLPEFERKIQNRLQRAIQNHRGVCRRGPARANALDDEAEKDDLPRHLAVAHPRPRPQRSPHAMCTARGTAALDPDRQSPRERGMIAAG